MEARLTTHARHELSRLLTSKLDDVRHDLSNADSDFESTRTFCVACCSTPVADLQLGHKILTA